MNIQKDLIDKLGITRSFIPIIFENLKIANIDKKDYIKFINKLLTIDLKEIYVIILLNSDLIKIFNNLNIAKLIKCREQKKDLFYILDNIALKTLFIKHFDKFLNFIDELSLHDIVYIHQQSIRNIADFDRHILNNDLGIFDCIMKMKDTFKEILGLKIQKTFNSPICIHSNNNKLITNNNETEFEFQNNNDNTQSPNVIIDYNNDEGRDVALILKTYRMSFLKPYHITHEITLNRIYSFETNRGRFYIQIIFNEKESKYYIFLFEYFDNYENLIQKHRKLNDCISSYLQLMDCPIYVCVAYRDIQLTLTDKDENIFVENIPNVEKPQVFYKLVKYFGDFLTTSTSYRNQNILSILFLVYGLVLTHMEKIYDKNPSRIPYADFILLKLENATAFEHSYCPYCKLGYRIVNKSVPHNKINLIDINNVDLKKSIGSNMNLIYSNNSYYLKDTKYINTCMTNRIKPNTSSPCQVSYIKDNFIHYINPSTYKIEDIASEKIKIKPDTIAYDILNQDLINIISTDLDNIPSKNLLNIHFMYIFDKFTQDNKISFLKRFYRNKSSNNNIN
jgi:hypothetical protein